MSECPEKTRKGPDAPKSTVAQTFGLPQDSAEALYVATQVRGKRVLLAESDALRAAADELGLPSATYAEIEQSLGKALESADAGEEG